MDQALVEQIAESLRYPYAQIRLLVDGHNVEATVEPKTKSRMIWVVVIYVDGKWCDDYLKEDSEIGQKFYPLVKKRLMTKKEYRAHVKVFGKREADKVYKKSLFCYRIPCHRDGRAFALHLKRHCQSVEVVS